VDQAHAAAPGQRRERAAVAQGARARSGRAARVQVRATDDRQPLDQHLGAGGAQIIAKGPRSGSTTSGLIALPVQSRTDQRELAIGPVAAAGGVQVEDPDRSQSSTVSARPAGTTSSPTSSGCRIEASSSRPSTSRGPGREK